MGKKFDEKNGKKDSSAIISEVLLLSNLGDLKLPEPIFFACYDSVSVFLDRLMFILLNIRRVCRLQGRGREYFFLYVVVPFLKL